MFGEPFPSHPTLQLSTSSRRTHVRSFMHPILLLAAHALYDSGRKPFERDAVPETGVWDLVLSDHSSTHCTDNPLPSWIQRSLNECFTGILDNHEF